ncbi:FUSC family protein [Achromobacter piechaudii]|uniref:p-hydroxybenzoic acid efflux pump subunit AaeB n=1 Tax=Achromobacter piechaudii TaxID=72556 RepID=A0A6S7DQD3_9BURK|nr:FUSC family protein [Achromobacter piechaudii]KNY08523.1 fusaric acid resistance protein [Achromobacter piechaudii]CAB3690261.1 p-hydroxybenzoic acid efflux pump subunit AaeB [Achromobacter piechaudii]CAB3862454.1 p-hydroxybenzoic acid efflux pump subunit AaeB [Achromobacter piechaudii]CAB3874738.1 p-hydroxybenzoic acid efflux pump subunit AaeB [Achromobacter piechaudii]CAB3949370.1 p-hydroxybenzoic acid efflux pump subunit AaeB [Achromobacter piechaudii]
MKLPNVRETIFSLKSYLSAIMALYLAYSIGLPRPFWAMTTAYVVAQPWSGAVRSKALYRLVGTFVGSAATVYMVPRLSNSPVVMTAAMVMWVGACLYMSVLDRTPRSYLFMLAGYTAAMIGFPSVSDPSLVFDTALARVEEISLGIVCATLVHSIVLPRGLAPALTLQLDKAVRDARNWMHDTLSGKAAEQRDRDRRVLANDITQLRLLSTHVPFDTSNLRWTSGAVRAMQDQISALTPAVSAVEDRLRALQANDQPLPDTVSALLHDISEWINAGAQASHDTAVQLRAAVAHATPAIDSHSTWRDALLASLMTRLRELIDTYDECLALRREIHAGLKGAPRRGAVHHARPSRDPNAALHRDHGMALLSALAAGVAISVCCAFWIGTAWSNGATAALMAAIFSCFFASQDNPVPGIMQFLTYTVYSIPLSALYLLGIMPAIHSFEMLALAMLPTAFVLGIFIARPASAGKAMAMLFGFLGTMALQDTNTADIVSFIDTQVAQCMGVATAAIIAAIFRTVSADWSARRIQAANWKELATLASSPRAPSRHTYTARMLDRIGLLQPRLALAQRPDDLVAADALKDLRVGRDITELQRARRHLPMAEPTIQRVLDSLAQFFRARSAWRVGDKTPEFLAQIDRALSSVAATPAGAAARDRAVVALVGIRRAFFPDAPDYQPAHPAMEGHAS